VWWQQLDRFHLEQAAGAAAALESEERLRFALEACHIGTWDLDLTDHTAYRSLEHAHIFGYTQPQGQWSFGRLLEHVLPEYRAAIEAAVREATAARRGWSHECPIRRADGEERWIWFSGRYHTDTAGRSRVTGVVQDITERKNHEEALRKAHEELTQANAALDEMVHKRTADLQEAVDELEHFSYTLTHDMRAPLRAIRGFAQLLQEDASSSSLDEPAKCHLDHIKKAAARMDAMITDALQYSWALRGEFPLKPVNVATLLQDLFIYYPNLQPPHAHIRLDGDFPLVLGNDAGLTQCFAHLLANAVNFVAPGTLPRVRVRAETHDDMVRFWVEDNGTGIPKEYHERIWVMFQRLGMPHEGTGIGLAIVRKLIQRMGGRVGVESEPDAGSRFWIELKRIS